MALSIPIPDFGSAGVTPGVNPISSSDADKLTAHHTASGIFWYYLFACSYYNVPFDLAWIKKAVQRWADGDKHTFDFWNAKYRANYGWKLGENELWPKLSPHIETWFYRQLTCYDYDNQTGFSDKTTGKQITFWNWKTIAIKQGCMIEHYESTYHLDPMNTDIEPDFDTVNDNNDLTIPTTEIPEAEFTEEQDVVILEHLQILQSENWIIQSFLNLYTGLCDWIMYLIGQREKEPLDILTILSRFVNNIAKG